MDIAAYPVGSDIRSADSDNRKAIAKVIASRPLRVEGQVISHIYVVKKINSKQSDEVFIFMHNEISNDVIE
jgi:hypothetical protein